MGTLNRFRSNALPALALAAAVALTLSACAPPESSKDPSDSPLSKYFAAFGGDVSDEDWEATFEEEQKRTEELVSECMTEAGFEYQPSDSSGGVTISDGEEWKFDDEDWVAEYGYGIVNWPGRDDAGDPSEEWVDPNEDYLNGLSESERTAYDETLWGPPIEVEGDAAIEWDWSTSGCYGWAQHEVQGDDPMQADEHKPIMEALQVFWTESSETPELAEVNAEWAACMAENGEPGFAAQIDAQNSINDEMNAFYESQTEYVEDDPELERIGEREVELALIDLTCREAVDFAAKSLEIQWKLEERFIADHKAELDALLADVQKKSGK